ncbi:hypothetical protein AMJ49_05635 [Parcubacteria bacterium DG_74_2]|nr:MAG: hypothetical protein AMJ49_05635 [Parcubacteria bacterium DG_74_2]
MGFSFRSRVAKYKLFVLRDKKAPARLRRAGATISPAKKKIQFSLKTKSLYFATLLPILDAFRTVDWKRIREEMETLKPVLVGI